MTFGLCNLWNCEVNNLPSAQISLYSHLKLTNNPLSDAPSLHFPSTPTLSGVTDVFASHLPSSPRPSSSLAPTCVAHVHSQMYRVFPAAGYIKVLLYKPSLSLSQRSLSSVRKVSASETSASPRWYQNRLLCVVIVMNTRHLSKFSIPETTTRKNSFSCSIFSLAISLFSFSAMLH